MRQVILNRRSDVDAWQRSVQQTLCENLRDPYWLTLLALFCADYFWLRQITVRFVIDWFGGSFERHGRDVYERHYRDLEQLSGGRYLNWTVEDGW